MLSPVSLSVRVSACSSNEAVHRIFCIDCSGSMSGDLSDMRTHLKNKIPTSIRETDLITIIWFSGKEECGVILEHISVKDVHDLVSIHRAVDQYLHTVGSTGFVDPIRLARTVAGRYPEIPQVFFLTDGGENSYDRETCRQAFREMAEIEMVIVEYGYCADRQFLNELADCSGATLIFNEDFERYSVSFDSYMSNRVVADRYESITPVLPLVYFQEGALKWFIPTPLIPSIRLSLAVERVWTVDETRPVDDRKTAYIAMLYGLATRNHVVMRAVVDSLGDIRLTKGYSTCFSRQDYVRLTEYVRECVDSPERAAPEGIDPAFRVKDDCFTVIQLIAELSQDRSTRLFPYHPSFVYRRISKEGKKEWPYFVANREIGATFSVVYHQSRANLSLGCSLHGHSVTEEREVTPEVAHRTYSIVKDGIKNVDVIPVSLSERLFTKLIEEGCIQPGTVYRRDVVYPIEIRHLPVVNRAYSTRRIDYRQFGSLHIRLHHLKSVMKYLTARTKEEVVKRNERDAAREAREAVRDFYVATELQVKIKGCSTIPPITEKLLQKLSGSVLTPSERFFKEIHLEWESIDVVARMAETTAEMNGILATLEEMKTALLIAGVWFDGVDIATKTFQVDDHTFTVEINETKVYLD